VLEGLTWAGGSRPRPDPRLCSTLVDAPREGPVRPEIRERLAILARR
jgi:acetoin utilization protein AcuC